MKHYLIKIAYKQVGTIIECESEEEMNKNYSDLEQAKLENTTLFLENSFYTTEDILYVCKDIEEDDEELEEEYDNNLE